MGHNAFVRGGVGSGLWSNVAVVHGYMEQLDQYCQQALNGDLGGTWAPASRIVIGGQGLEVAGIFQADASAVFSAGLAANALSLFTAGLTVSGGTLAVNAAGFFVCSAPATFLASSGNSFQGDTTFAGAHTYVFAAGTTLSVAAATTSFSTGTVAFLNGFSANTGGAVGFAVPVTFGIGSAPTLQDTTTLAAGAMIRYRVFDGPDAPTTIPARTYDYVKVGVLSSNQIYKLADSTDGDHIVVDMSIFSSGAFTLTIQRQNGTTMITGMKFNTTGVVNRAEFWNRAGVWEIISQQYNP